MMVITALNYDILVFNSKEAASIITRPTQAQYQAGPWTAYGVVGVRRT
jgi:hypothetical protein